MWGVVFHCLCSFSFFLAYLCYGCQNAYLLYAITYLCYGRHTIYPHYLLCTELARTVHTHRTWPYVRWFPCQEYRIYTVCTYKCMVLANPTKGINETVGSLDMQGHVLQSSLFHLTPVIAYFVTAPPSAFRFISLASSVWPFDAGQALLNKACPPRKDIWYSCQTAIGPALNCKHVGLARTVYIHRIRPLIWWFPCQEYRVCTLFIWHWPTLQARLSLHSQNKKKRINSTGSENHAPHYLRERSHFGAGYRMTPPPKKSLPSRSFRINCCGVCMQSAV
jgi:hypothetical protein